MRIPRALLAGAVAALALAQAAAAFEPNDPLAARQWHLAVNRAFEFWVSPPVLPPVRVAVIDSGIDAGHPDLVDEILDARSFVGGSAREDESGPGTFVAGLIAAAVGNAEGVAGMAPSAQLLIAKVVSPGGTIDIAAEARAIRWAVNQGARVINLSPAASGTRATATSTASRRSRSPLSPTPRVAAWSSSPRSATATVRPRSPGRMRATPPRFRTCSVSARSRGTAPRPPSRTATGSSTTSRLRGWGSSPPSLAR
jgi:hypothetical protein